MPILPPRFSIAFPAGARPGPYAGKLLDDLGAELEPVATATGDHPARRAAESGLMSLTGAAGGPPLVCPVPLASCADDTLDAFRAVAQTDVLPATSGSQLLTERAAILGRQRNGGLSPGGHCRLLPTLDGMIGLNLARDDDWELLAAWLQTDVGQDWQVIAPVLETRATGSLLERGRMLGLAVVDAASVPVEPCDWVKLTHRAAPAPRIARSPRVLDLSSLWAGPLCSHLWQAAGAEVTRVESTRRPDGARSGSREFFGLMNQGKREVTLDLHTPAGRHQLHQLIQQADIVLEGSRPRALRQMSIIAEEMLDSSPGLTWVSITGYGRQEPQGNWIAYGDDAGVAAGLSAIMHEATGEWLFCGDAIADPLTGMHAAVAGWASWLAGGGHLLELSLEQTVRHCITATAPEGNDYRGRQARWSRYLEDNAVATRAPRRRRGSTSAH